jgi:hypothetical protein
MKYPMKLCPLRPATRAGQKATATQIRARMIQPNVDTARTGISTPPCLSDQAAYDTKPRSRPTRNIIQIG